jgi:hypothetical protein
MHAPFRKAAGIESDDAIGLSQPLDSLPNQHAYQRAMIPRGGANEVLHNQALDIDQGRNHWACVTTGGDRDMDGWGVSGGGFG